MSKYKLYKVTFNENALDWLDVLPDNLVFRSKTHKDVVQYVVHCIFPTVSYCLDCFTVDKVDVCTLFKTV